MRKAIAFVLMACLVVLLVGCAPRVKTFSISDVSKITVFSGSTGKSIEIVDRRDISNITMNFNELTFTRDKSSKNNEGFDLYINWYNEDGEKTESVIIMNGDRISYNDYFYDVFDTDKVIDVEYIYDLFE